MPEKSQKQMIQETHDSVIKLETTIPFVIDEIKDVKVNVKNLSASHGKLKKNFWILVGVLVGSGVLGTGIYGLLNGG